MLGSGRVQLRRPGRTTVYRPIRGYRLPRNESDPAPAAIVGLLGLALVGVLLATGILGPGEGGGGSVQGATPTPSLIAASPTREPLPTEEATEEPTSTPTPRPTARTHVVRPGENLTRIAQQYGVTVAQIVEANDLANPSQISVGLELIIPPPG